MYYKCSNCESTSIIVDASIFLNNMTICEPKCIDYTVGFCQDCLGTVSLIKVETENSEVLRTAIKKSNLYIAASSAISRLEVDGTNTLNKLVDELVENILKLDI